MPTFRQLVFPLLIALLGTACSDPASTPAAKTAGKPALTVTVIQPESEPWPQTLSASGNIAAWQEAVIGAELGGYRITEVLAQVGDRVRKGQLLARIASDTVDNEWAESQAAVAEAEAVLTEAKANLARANQLREKGFYSPQQNSREQTATDSALARLNAARARLQSAELRRSKASVLAPDDGILSARMATVGSLAENGKELFRLIRGGRLEWRAEITANDLYRLKTGQSATLTAPDGQTLSGRVRIVAPTADPQTRLALVYVDLDTAAARHVSAGMFVRGEFDLAEQTALTLPQSAVLLRDGFHYVFKLEAATDGMAKVSQLKVEAGRQRGQRIEIMGLPADSRVVASGVGFLADGDTVKLVSPVAGTR